MNAITMMAWIYIAYLAISLALIAWVAQTLRRHGKVLLLNSTDGDETLAGAFVHLLVIGFYLVNIGFTSLALRFGGTAHDLQGAIELLSIKVGYVLVILGATHFLMLAVFAKARQRPRTHATPIRRFSDPVQH